MQQIEIQTQPLVSVLMPAYNGERYIEAAIRSVMAQTLQDWELVVLDDDSRDATAEIIKKLAQEDPRIRFYQNPRNLGSARTRNRGLNLCRGTYVALLDCDDLWYPEKLEQQVRVARQEQADIVYCSYSIVDAAGDKRCRDFLVPEQVSLDMALVRSVISCSTALLGKRVTQNYRFPLGYYHEDLALWLLLLEDGLKAVGTTQVLAQYRIGMHSRAANKLTAATHRWRIYRQMMGLPLGKSSYYFWQYAAAGLDKYQRI